MTLKQIENIRRIRAEIDDERDGMDGDNDPHPTGTDIKIITNPHPPIAQQN